LAVARKNAAEHGVADRLELIESDLLAALPPDRSFDYIVSNPPYVTSGEIAHLARDVQEHEPLRALDGGPQGTAVIERLVPQAAERLPSGGWLLMEIGPAVEAAVRELITADANWELMPTKRDLAGLARVIIANRT
jgi:release factor glutamine methyltransferase